MRSLSTRVPPVTALRSPPLSRITGADSPVMAASSTLAIPSITSPSAGMMSPASQTTRSPFCNIGAGTFSSRPLRRRRAIVSLRALRRLAACALPRPSATASAKLAKSTVNQSQIASCATKPRSAGSASKNSHSGQRRAHHGHEHDRVFDHQTRVEFLERVADRRPGNVPIKERRSFCFIDFQPSMQHECHKCFSAVGMARETHLLHGRAVVHFAATIASIRSSFVLISWFS